MKDDLTKRQKQIHDFINDQINLRGYPQSVREICKAVGLKSTSTVHMHLKSLENKGYIVKEASSSRAMKIIDDNQILDQTSFISHKELIDIPIIGRVTAGQPILATENIEDTFPLPVEFAGNSETFMLTVSGESMINAGILDGDLVIVQKTNIARNGDIVVALLDDEATIKTFYKEANYFRLQPENDSMEPIIATELIILGKVSGLIRKF